jgi:hypothetical protein
MFGTVLEKLSGWFGQSYLVARFFPCLVAAVADLAVAYVAFPAMRPQLRFVLANATASDVAGYLLLALAGIAVAAYTLSPFVRVAVRLLEGSWLLAPDANKLSRWFGEQLVVSEGHRLDELARREHELFQNRVDLPSSAEIRARLARARAVGERLREVPSAALIDEAEQRVKALITLRECRRTIAAEDLKFAIDILEDALQLNCANRSALHRYCSDDDRKRATTLTDLQRTMVSVLAVYARDIAEDAETRVVDRKDQVFARAELAPTRFGNLSAALRSYCKTRYGIEFGYFWPRFLLSIQKNPTLSTAISNANVQVEFAVAALALTVLSLMLWLALFIAFFTGPLRLFLLAALGPPAVELWLGVIETSYKEYADTVRSAVDLGRFELLAALRQPLPPTLESERQLWDRLARLALFNERGPDRALIHSSGPNAPTGRT